MGRDADDPWVVVDAADGPALLHQQTDEDGDPVTIVRIELGRGDAELLPPPLREEALKLGERGLDRRSAPGR